MSAGVITEFAAWFSLYRCCTSGGRENTLKWGLVVFNGGGAAAVGDGPVPVPVRAASVPGVVVTGVATGVVVLNGVNAIPVRSSGMNPGMKYSLLIWNSMLEILDESFSQFFATCSR